MPITETFVRQVKHSGAPAGDKHADGGGMYLLVKSSGKYWRLNYRFGGKQKTLALGVYPQVTLADARRKRAEARTRLATGEDPSEVKKAARLAQLSVGSGLRPEAMPNWSSSPHSMLRYLTIRKFSAESGYTEDAIRTKIRDGIWVEGELWVRAPDRRILIDVMGYENWVESEPILKVFRTRGVRKV